MSKHVAPQAQISPKVTAAAVTSLVLVAVQAVLTAVTPAMFEWAGEFQGLVYSVVTAVGAAVAAYLKTDPLRNVGGDAVQAGEIPPADLPHPDAVPTDDLTAAEALLAQAKSKEV